MHDPEIHENPYRLLIRFLCFAVLAVPGFCLAPFIRQQVDPGLKLAPDVHTVLLGDSHVSLSLDDGEMPGIRNMAEPGEGYIFTLAKLERLANQNPELREVIVGLSYHNICATYDEYVTEPRSIQRYANLMSLPDACRLVQRELNPVFIARLGHVLASTPLGEQPYSGGYCNPYPEKNAVSPEGVQKRIHQSFYMVDAVSGLSAFNLHYLKQIQTFCTEGQLTCSFLMTPLHPLYREQIPASIVTSYSQILKEHDLQMMDFSSLMAEDHYFLEDGDHLSFEGTQEFTKSFYVRWQEQQRRTNP